MEFKSIFNKEIDQQQCEEMCSIIMNCFKYLPMEISLNISEYACGEFIKCMHCKYNFMENNSIHFLLSQDSASQCINPQCNIKCTKWSCKHAGCTYKWAFDCEDADIQGEQGYGTWETDFVVCVHFDSNHCGSSYCESHSVKYGKHCILCGVYECKDCEPGEYCPSCGAYFCGDHDPIEFPINNGCSQCSETHPAY